MVIPLMKQAADEQGVDKYAALHCGAAWAEGAVRAVDARRDLRVFLARASRSGRAAFPASLVVDAELVVSELVTNALRHAPGPCGLKLHLTSRELVITVSDTSREVPVVKKPDRHRVGGHGLPLVHTVSDRVAVTPHEAGKQITAYLRLSPSDGGGADRAVLPSSLSGRTRQTS